MGEAAMPRRIQRKRTKGWRMPDGTVYVGRPTRWGNPWRVLDESYTVEGVVERFRFAIQTDDPSVPSAEDIRSELAGLSLACWCPLDKPCHADVLLAVANAEPTTWGTT